MVIDTIRAMRKDKKEKAKRIMAKNKSSIPLKAEIVLPKEHEEVSRES